MRFGDLLDFTWILRSSEVLNVCVSVVEQVFAIAVTILSMQQSPKLSTQIGDDTRIYLATPQ